jgi:copper resistance protein C
MRLILFMLILGWGLVSAHAELESSTPAANSTVKELPRTISVTFSESVEVRLSTFKIYRLEAPPESWGSPTRLRRLAEPLVKRVLPLKNDQSARADSGILNTERTSKTIRFGPLKPGSPAGAYIVMWRNLATDGHTKTGFFVFVYNP